MRRDADIEAAAGEEPEADTLTASATARRPTWPSGSRTGRPSGQSLIGAPKATAWPCRSPIIRINWSVSLAVMAQARTPEDFLDSFTSFVRNNINKIAALTVVVQRPRELTRAQLRELRLELDKLGFTDTALRTAWQNQERGYCRLGHRLYSPSGDRRPP